MLIYDLPGEIITQGEAEVRRQNYERENKGCFIYDGVIDLSSKSVRYSILITKQLFKNLANRSPVFYWFILSTFTTP